MAHVRLPGTYAGHNAKQVSVDVGHSNIRITEGVIADDHDIAEGQLSPIVEGSRRELAALKLDADLLTVLGHMTHATERPRNPYIYEGFVFVVVVLAHPPRS